MNVVCRGISLLAHLIYQLASQKAAAGTQGTVLTLSTVYQFLLIFFYTGDNGNVVPCVPSHFSFSPFKPRALLLLPSS